MGKILLSMLTLFLLVWDTENCQPELRLFYQVGSSTFENSTHFCVQASYWPQTLSGCSGGCASDFPITVEATADGGYQTECDTSQTKCCQVSAANSVEYSILYLCSSTGNIANSDAFTNSVKIQYFIKYSLGASEGDTTEVHSLSVADHVISLFSFTVEKYIKTITRKTATTCSCQNCYSNGISEATCNRVTTDIL